MKFLLLATKPYSIAVLTPIFDVVNQRKEDEVRWFVGKNIDHIPLPGKRLKTTAEVNEFHPHAVIVPGNVVPHFWPGIKVQIFHGMGEEKRGHYRITGFFDLYCTPGPHMTEAFLPLQKKHNTFLVKETGWSKLDMVSRLKETTSHLRESYFPNDNPIILFAPTFSPRYSSFSHLFPVIKDMVNEPINWLIKFHDLMDKESVIRARSLESPTFKVVKSDNILPLMSASHLMVADTSSVTYEYMMFDKPIITYKATTRKDKGINLESSSELRSAIYHGLEHPEDYAHIRKQYLDVLHPYNDGNSSERIVEAIRETIKSNGINSIKKKRPSWIRKRQVRKLFP